MNELHIDKSNEMFNKIGHLTRTLHQTLLDLGYDKEIEKVSHNIPDAKQRLAYIATMTEQAANKTLNSVDSIIDIPTNITHSLNQVEQLIHSDLSKEDLVAELKKIMIADRKKECEKIKEELMNIMLAQDFQDLTGQVIKKIVHLADEMEQSLYNFLIEFSPEEASKIKEYDNSLMNGPVIDKAQKGVVNNQEQVDDLLSSLGF